MTTATDWTEYTPEGSKVGTPAGWGPRWGARGIDLGVWIGGVFAVRALGYGALVTVGVAIAWALLWLVLPAWRWGRTGGKWLCRLRVARADGSPLDLRRALLREAFVLASLAIPLIGLLNGLTGVNDPRRQGLHDKVFATLVVAR